MLPWPELVLPLNCTYARFNDEHQDSNKSLHAASEIIVLHQTWTETTTKKIVWLRMVSFRTVTLSLLGVRPYFCKILMFMLNF